MSFELIDYNAYKSLMDKFNSLTWKERLIASQIISEECDKAYQRGYQQAKKELAKKKKVKKSTRTHYEDDDNN